MSKELMVQKLGVMFVTLTNAMCLKLITYMFRSCIDLFAVFNNWLIDHEL